MKALVHLGAAKKALHDRPEPEIAAPTDAIVRMHWLRVRRAQRQGLPEPEPPLRLCHQLYPYLSHLVALLAPLNELPQQVRPAHLTLGQRMVVAGAPSVGEQGAIEVASTLQSAQAGGPLAAAFASQGP